MSLKSHSQAKKWSWRSRAFRGLIYQVLAIGTIALVVWFLATNTLHNMRVRGIQSGFDFLSQPAGFSIGESLFAFDSEESYLRAFLVGLSNTLRTAVAGIILATILGTIIGVGRFSRNALVRGLCTIYVECFRNIPVLIQLLMWYLLITDILPPIIDAWQAGPFFLSKGGVNFPIPVWHASHAWSGLGLIAGMALVWRYRRWAKNRFEATGLVQSVFWVPCIILIVSGFLGWLLGGAPTKRTSLKVWVMNR